jgi:hypothetical protein
MKSFEDHLYNLAEIYSVEYTVARKEFIQLIYDIIKYELEGTSTFIKSVMQSIRMVADQGFTITKIEMSFETFKLFEKERKLSGFTPEINLPTILKTGVYGRLYGKPIYKNNDLELGKIKVIPGEKIIES